MSHLQTCENRLAIFAKHWAPGFAKTRLAAQLGVDLASRLQRLFVDVLQDQLSAAGDVRTWVITPSESLGEFRQAVGTSWLVAPQSPGTLGERLESYLKPQWSQSSARLVVLGSDCPEVTGETVEQAFELLRHSDVVLGPASDGGYYLIGLSRWLPLFDSIDWSTPQVLSQTLARLKSLGATCRQLPLAQDVDRLEDLEQLWQRVNMRVARGDASGPQIELHRRLALMWTEIQACREMS